MNALRLKKGGFNKDIAALANEASITVDSFLAMDPITYGAKIWGRNGQHCCLPEIKKILGWQNYNVVFPFYYKAYKGMQMSPIVVP